MRTLLTALAAVLVTLTGTATAAHAAETTPRLALVPPTGPLPVAADTLHLVDADRADPWVPAQRRELMVTMWYPTALPPRPGRTAPYLTTAESKAFLDFERAQGVPIPADVPDDAVAHVRTHAGYAAPPLPRPGGRPLVVLSPGFTLPRGTLTGLAEELASHGYVVAAVDHAYESSGTSFPSGLKTCVACDIADPTEIPPVRAADVSFLLDRLTGRHPAWRYARVVDTHRIAMVGHSIGGAAAATGAVGDARIDAGVDIDGTVYDPLPATGLSKPFLLLGTQSLHHAGGDDPTWDTTWERLHGPRHWFTVDGTGHLSFTDTVVLANQLGISDPTAPLPGVRATEITRAYVRTFLDRYLRGRPATFPSYPEVRPQP